MKELFSISSRKAHGGTKGTKRIRNKNSVISVPLCEIFFGICIVFMLFMPVALHSQEEFGDFDEGFGSFGDFGDFGSGGFGVSSSSGPSVRISGRVSAELTGFLYDFGSPEKAGNTSLGDIFTGHLNFEAAGSAAQAVINLKLSPVFDGSSPVELDEAYVRTFFGPVSITGGFRKLTWGKADSFGPLDLINPLDFTDLTKLSDPQSIKLARPMIHAAWSLGAFSRLEAVFVPWFQGQQFDSSGRWTPRQMRELRAGANLVMDMAVVYEGFDPDVAKQILMNLNKQIDSGDIYPETYTLQYAQGGLRFTTTTGSSDLGFQYYFGRLHRPAVTGFSLHPEALVPNIAYNYYHHIGVDFARVIRGFNLRTEMGANITGDLDGRDGTVENPALVWSLGFDRDIVWGINLNLQGTGRLTLFHGRINNNPLLDCEAGTDLSSTRITGIVSRKFLRDELELKTTALWGIEDRDFLIMPALIWTWNDVSTELSMGFFGGDRRGELGQYSDDCFIKVMLSYRF